MSTLFDMARDGGPAMYLLILMTAVSVLWIIVWGIAEFARVRVPVVVWLLPQAALWVVGALGWFANNWMAEESVRAASDKHLVGATDLAASHYPAIFGAVLVGHYALLSLALLAMALFVSARARTPGRQEAQYALFAGLGGLVLLVLAQAFSASRSGGFLFLASLLVLMGSVRWSTDPVEQTRLARGRLAMGLLSLAGAAGYGVAEGLSMQVEAYKAAAGQSVSLESVAAGGFTGLGFGVVVVVVALPVLWPAVARRGSVRLWEVATAAVLAVLCLTAIVVAAVSRQDLLVILGAIPG